MKVLKTLALLGAAGMMLSSAHADGVARSAVLFEPISEATRLGSFPTVIERKAKCSHKCVRVATGANSWKCEVPPCTT
jgi:hypothetical protein